MNFLKKWGLPIIALLILGVQALLFFGSEKENNTVLARAREAKEAKRLAEMAREEEEKVIPPDVPVV